MNECVAYVQAFRDIAGTPKAKEYWNWVLRTGETFIGFDKPDEKLVDLIRPKIKQCFMNSQRAILDKPFTFKYYEGWFYQEGVPMAIHHAWVVNSKTLRVVDLTLGIKGKVAGIVREALDPAKVHYFGVHIPHDFVLKNMRETGIFGDVLWRYAANVL